MQFDDIEKYFSEGKLVEFLEHYREHFEKIECYQEELRKGVLITPEQVDEAMKELTGIYMIVSFAAEIVISIVNQKDSILSEKLQGDATNFGKSPNPTVIKKEVQSKLKDFIRVRNILKAYTKSCDKAIYSCQSSLKHMKKEYGFNR